VLNFFFFLEGWSVAIEDIKFGEKIGMGEFGGKINLDTNSCLAFL